MLTRLYSLIWHLFYFVVCTFEALYYVKLWLQTMTLWSYDLFSSQVSIDRRNYLFFQKHKTKLSKLPKHLNIIIGPKNNDVNGKMLTRIFTYALQMNINYISFYDTRLVEDGYVQMKDIIIPKGIQCDKLHEHHMKWTFPYSNGYKCNTELNGKIAMNGSTKHNLTNGAINGKSNGVQRHKYQDKTIEIFKITPSEGRTLLAEVCKHLFKLRHTQEIQELLKNRDLLAERINIELLKRVHGLPDPELSIIFNHYTSTFGLMPWQTRFTEFHTISTKQYFNAKSFMNVLFRYSRCEQRWGK